MTLAPQFWRLLFLGASYSKSIRGKSCIQFTGIGVCDLMVISLVDGHKIC